MSDKTTRVRKTNRFAKTVRMEELNVLSRNPCDLFDPFEIFEKCSALKVREVCLQAMKHYNVANGEVQLSCERADWTEACIIDLLKQGDDEMAVKLLEWYVYTDQTDRAIKFIFNDERVYYANTPPLTLDWLTKTLFGKLKRYPNRGALEILDKFINNLLNKVIGELKRPTGGLDASWQRAERALAFVCRKDHSSQFRFWLWDLEKALEKHQSGNSDNQPFETIKRLAVVKETLRVTGIGQCPV